MPQNKPILLVDQDGILADLHTPWCELYNALHPDNILTIENTLDWGMSHCKHKDDLFKILGEGELYRHLKPLPGAIENLTKLNELGIYDIYILTAPPNVGTHIITHKLDWVKEHLPWIDARHFIACYNKSLIRGQFLIDDGPHNLLDWAAANREFGQETISISYPYNTIKVDYLAGNYTDTATAWRNIYNHLKDYY